MSERNIFVDQTVYAEIAFLGKWWNAEIAYAMAT